MTFDSDASIIITQYKSRFWGSINRVGTDTLLYTNIANLHQMKYLNYNCISLCYNVWDYWIYKHLNTDDKDMRIKNTAYTYTTCQDNNTDQQTLVYKFTI